MRLVAADRLYRGLSIKLAGSTGRTISLADQRAPVGGSIRPARWVDLEADHRTNLERRCTSSWCGRCFTSLLDSKLWGSWWRTHSGTIFKETGKTLQSTNLESKLWRLLNAFGQTSRRNFGNPLQASKNRHRAESIDPDKHSEGSQDGPRCRLTTAGRRTEMRSRRARDSRKSCQLSCLNLTLNLKSFLVKSFVFKV